MYRCYIHVHVYVGVNTHVEARGHPRVTDGNRI